jgi:hypothetical protein
LVIGEEEEGGLNIEHRTFNIERRGRRKCRVIRDQRREEKRRGEERREG